MIHAMKTENGIYAAPRDVANIADCFFYHTMNVPGQGTIQGSFDLRVGLNYTPPLLDHGVL